MEGEKKKVQGNTVTNIAYFKTIDEKTIILISSHSFSSRKDIIPIHNG